MKCPNCKSPIDDNATICEWCDYHLRSEFNIILISFNESKKIPVIKEVRGVTGLGLKEALDLVEGAPKLLKKTTSKEEAAKIKKQLTAAGGTIEIQ
jgi:large subunit ribosomal protein L7/L12